MKRDELREREKKEIGNNNSTCTKLDEIRMLENSPRGKTKSGKHSALHNLIWQCWQGILTSIPMSPRMHLQHWSSCPVSICHLYLSWWPVSDMYLDACFNFAYAGNNLQTWMRFWPPAWERKQAALLNIQGKHHFAADASIIQLQAQSCSWKGISGDHN